MARKFGGFLAIVPLQYDLGGILINFSSTLNLGMY
jgi:hypothetical protein